jgi:anti-anti-sigma factor
MGSLTGSDERVVEAGELMVKLSVEPEVAVLELYGELDLASAEALERELRRAEQAVETGSVIVDLGALAFIDSTGLSILVAAQRRAEGAPWKLGFLRPAGEPTRLFELTGLDQTLPFLD